MLRHYAADGIPWYDNTRCCLYAAAAVTLERWYVPCRVIDSWCHYYHCHWFRHIHAITLCWWLYAIRHYARKSTPLILADIAATLIGCHVNIAGYAITLSMLAITTTLRHFQLIFHARLSLIAAWLAIYTPLLRHYAAGFSPPPFRFLRLYYSMLRQLILMYFIAWYDAAFAAIDATPIPAAIIDIIVPYAMLAAIDLSPSMPTLLPLPAITHIAIEVLPPYIVSILALRYYALRFRLVAIITYHYYLRETPDCCYWLRHYFTRYAVLLLRFPPYIIAADTPLPLQRCHWWLLAIITLSLMADITFRFATLFHYWWLILLIDYYRYC